ncbi:MAG TPA: PilZ domain-containing protein [Terracidiphilus sp.]|nr:PilZ domain-containing protein [Terracidiphilus sp.]
MEAEENAKGMGMRGAERRAQPRFAVDGEATLLLMGHGRPMPCWVTDLSLEGCRLRTRERFSARTQVRVEVAFRVNGMAFRLSGITQWSDGWNLVGIRFVDVPQRRRADLAEVIGEVGSEIAAKAAMQAPGELAAERQADQPAATGQPAARAAELAEVWNPEGSGIHRVAEQPRGQRAEDRPADAGAGGPAQRERRAQQRHWVDTCAVIHLVNIGSRLSGRIVDLSLGGCRIRTDERFPVGIYTRVETEFRVEGLPFRLGGVIQAIHDRRVVGIRFLDLSERKRDQLAQLMREMEARGDVREP